MWEPRKKRVIPGHGEDDGLKKMIQPEKDGRAQQAVFVLCSMGFSFKALFLFCRRRDQAGGAMADEVGSPSPLQRFPHQGLVFRIPVLDQRPLPAFSWGLFGT